MLQKEVHERKNKLCSATTKSGRFAAGGYGSIGLKSTKPLIGNEAFFGIYEGEMCKEDRII